MAKSYLTINIGSQSKKYALFDQSGQVLKTAHLEDEHYRDNLDELFNEPDLMVGIRVVAPGEYFLSHRLIDDGYLSELNRAAELAPLHVGPTRAEILRIKTVRPELRLYGLSDSVFFASRDLEAKLYGLPRSDAEQLGLFRYGYHGLSIASILAQLETVGAALGRLVVCHLGGGVSITALNDGQVIETSMGFTPLEGPVMSSRSGLLDPAAVLALMTGKQLTPQALEEYLNQSCGLLGLSEHSASVRELLSAEAQGNTKAELALKVFVRGIKKHLGAAAALLGGVDTLIFTATIGERSKPIRERVATNLVGLGLKLDLEKNRTVPDPLSEVVTWIQNADSSAKIGVMQANEDQQMFKILSQNLEKSL